MPQESENKISRRCFLAIAVGATVPSLISAKKEVPALLDHILLGCADLDSGIDLLEQRTGVRPVFGGVHPGRGTRNALLALGERRYLEVIAPDPKQDRIEDFAQKQVARLKGLASPRLIGWAAHPGNLETFAAHLRDVDIPFDGPRPGSRQRPDGKLLEWKTLNLKDDQEGLLPFFIEWSAGSPHPSTDAPKGCTLRSFDAAAPTEQELAKTMRQLQLDIAISKGEKAALHAIIVGPKGELIVSS
jgi:hypothetical protein